jgi:probable glucitol transport protein GutA
LVAGYVVDRTNTRWGRGRPYEWAVVGMWLTTLLMFSCPPEISLLAKCAWVFSMYVFNTSIFTTFLNTSDTVYMVRAFNKQEHYVAIKSYGSILVMLPVVAFNVSFPMLMGRLATSAEGWRTLLLIYSVPLALIGMLRFFTVKETHNIDATTEKVNLKDVFLVLRKNPYIYIVAVLVFVFNLMTNMGVNAYYFTYIVKNIDLMGIWSATQIVILPVVFAFPGFIKKFSVKTLILLGLIVTTAGYILNFFALDNFPMLVVGAILVGGGNVPISMLFPLMIIDCAEYNEHKKMQRLEGAMTGVTSFATKVGAAFGAGVMGVLLAASGYTGTADTPASSILMIRMLFSLIPVAFYILCVVVTQFYKLEKQMPQIRKENEEARKEARTV